MSKKDIFAIIVSSLYILFVYAFTILCFVIGEQVTGWFIVFSQDIPVTISGLRDLTYYIRDK